MPRSPSRTRTSEVNGQNGSELTKRILSIGDSWRPWKRFSQNSGWEAAGNRLMPHKLRAYAETLPKAAPKYDAATVEAKAAEWEKAGQPEGCRSCASSRQRSSSQICRRLIPSRKARS